MWAKLFGALWKTFGAEFDNILTNLKAHRALIEAQANLIQYSEITKTRDLAKAALDTTTRSVHDVFSICFKDQCCRIHTGDKGNGERILRGMAYSAHEGGS